MKDRDNISTKIPKRNSSLLTATINILLWVGMVAIWYVILGFTVDMPAEYKLRHSTDKLRAEHTSIKERYEELTEVIENVERRDENVFRKLFESNPYDLTIDSDNERIALHESLMNMNNDELLQKIKDVGIENVMKV